MINPVAMWGEWLDSRQAIAERDAALQRVAALEAQLAEAQMRSVDERNRTNYHYQETVSLRREVAALQPHALVARNAELETQLAEAEANYRFHYDMVQANGAWAKTKLERAVRSGR